MSKQIVLGKVKGDKGDTGFSPIVDLSKEDGVLNISVTDIEGTKTESIVTGENVQGDFLETDTSKGSYIWNKPTIPSKVSELENDLNYQMANTTYRLDKSGNSIILTGSDGTSTSVLDADTDTTYGSADANNDGLMTKEFVQKLNSIAEGAQVNSITGIKGDNETSYRTGQVNITPENIGAEKEGIANSLVSTHNTSTTSHSDIRTLISDITARLNALANSTDAELDQMAELVEYIKDNRELIECITTNKVNVSDIVDNLTTNISNKVLAASQGVALKSLIDALQIEVNSKATDNHSHNDMYYTESEIDSKLSGKANASHGNHVPTVETANNAKFLRNDNTWQTVTPANIGAAASSHGTHVTYDTTAPKANGTASAGSSSNVARADHVHPLQTSVTGSSGSCTGNSATATKATQDESGNNIKASYASSASLSSNNQLVLKSKSGATLSTVDLGGLGGGSTNIYNQKTEPAVSTSGATVWLVY